MVTFGRILLWAVVLIAPGGFLLVPLLAAASLHSKSEGSVTFRQQLNQMAEQARASLRTLQRHWTKS